MYMSHCQSQHQQKGKLMEQVLIYVSVIGGIIAALKIIAPPLISSLKNNWFRRNEISENSDVIKDIQKMNREQALILLLVLDHIIDGNNVDEIKKTRLKFKEYLFEDENKDDE